MPSSRGHLALHVLESCVQRVERQRLIAAHEHFAAVGEQTSARRKRHADK